MRTPLLAGFALFAAIPAVAAPITTTYSVQFISVCDDLGNNCAPVPIPSNPADPTRSLENPLDVMNRIYEQEGIRFAPVMSGSTLDIRHLNATALQNPDLRVDAQLNSVTSADGFAQLTRGPQLQSIGVSPSSSTLNVFFVNDLRALDVNGNTIPNSVLRGVGWLNGNGVIVDQEARLDTLAHEIGHNLGLNHDPAPTNIMASGENRRPITTTINDVNPNGQKLDQLTAAQGVDARSPLFANGTARVLVDGLSVLPVFNQGALVEARQYSFDFEQTSTDRRLAKIQLFFAPGKAPGIQGNAVKIETQTASIIEVTFATPLEPGASFDLRTTLGVPGLFELIDPLFIRYVFDNGVASQALFDANDDMASDDPANQFLFAGTPDANGRPLEFQSSTIEISAQEIIAATEPAMLALFGSTLFAGIWIMPRRRARVPA
jgi:hypothetical protein